MTSSSSTTTTAAEDDKTTLYFYGHRSSPDAYLSQWYPSPFTSPATPTTPSVTYGTAEQYMMYQKAILFSCPHIANQILATTSPRTQKSLGRKVTPFSQTTWEAHRLAIVEEGTYLKFKYGEDKGELEHEGVSLKDRLLATGGRELVEASPMDRVWGVGFGKNKAEEMRGTGKWGLNLLGVCLIKVRERLRAEEEEKNGFVIVRKEEVEEEIESTTEKVAEEGVEKKAIVEKREAVDNIKIGTEEDQRPKKRARRAKKTVST